MDERLDDALMNVLMFCPQQEARAMASDLRAAKKVSKDKLRRILKLAARVGWEDYKSIGVIKDVIKGRKGKPCRASARKEQRRSTARR